MPLIQVKLVAGVFDAAEKEAIIEKLTDAMVSVEGEAMRPVTWVTIDEVASGEWGIAGKALHTGALVGMRSAAAVAELTTAPVQPISVHIADQSWQRRLALGVAKEQTGLAVVRLHVPVTPRLGPIAAISGTTRP